MSDIDFPPRHTATILEKYQAEIEKIVGFKVRFVISSYDGRVSIKKTESPSGAGWLARWKLAPMPGCCGVIVSTDAWVHEALRGRGFNTLLNKVRQEIAESGGYGMIICTTIASNEPENKTLLKNGFILDQTFRNPKTNRDLNLWSKKLT